MSFQFGKVRSTACERSRTLWGRTSGGAFLSAQRVGAAIGHEGVYFYSRLSHRVERVYINANSNH